MKFSIIMPTYNREKFIQRAINSILSQDYEDWELITVDDCSSDGSYGICKSFAEKDKRIIALKNKENSGPSYSRNEGLKNCTGDYILFLDDDDAYSEDALTVLKNTVTKFDNPEIICYGYKNGDNWYSQSKILCDKGIITHDFILKNILPEHINIKPQSEMFLQVYSGLKCFKRDLIKDNQIIFDDFRRTWEDNPFLVKCLAKTDSLVCIENPLYCVLGTASSNHLSAKFSLNMLWGYIQTYSEYSQNFGHLFNFENEYTAHRYFTNVCNIMRGLANSISSEEYDKTVRELLSNEKMNLWIKVLKPNNKVEKKICNCIIEKDSNGFKQSIFETQPPVKTSLVKRVLNKAKSVIKK